MVEPKRAPVEPKVLAPVTGERVRLVDLVGDLVAAGETGAVRLTGGPGSGRTTALRHLEAAFPTEPRLLLLDDEPRSAVQFAASRALAVYAGPSADPTGAGREWTLAAWDEDDLIECLLATRPDRCASLMRRLDASDEAVRGWPAEILRIVLDEMAEDEGLPGPSAALRGCHLDGMDLAGADFQGADLRGAALTGAFLPGANLEGADLRDSHLADANLERANLCGADLRGASFHMGSSRSGLVFSPRASEGTRTGFYADDLLEEDYLPAEERRKANLRGADLGGANLEGVDLWLVDLRDARMNEQQEAWARRCGAILSARVRARGAGQAIRSDDPRGGDEPEWIGRSLEEMELSLTRAETSPDVLVTSLGLPSEIVTKLHDLGVRRLRELTQVTSGLLHGAGLDDEAIRVVRSALRKLGLTLADDRDR